MAISSPEMTRNVVTRWFDALSSGNGQAALVCLADDVRWINSPPDKGLSDIIRWLGDFHGRDAVAETFIVWGQLSQVNSFELVELVINGDEALAIIHEVATIKATGLKYDIEFIQRIRIADDAIVFWKSYWDTSKGIVAFRGNMHDRLIAAARGGSVKAAELLLPFGAEANAVDATSGLSALMLAAGRGDAAMVALLLAAGADPNLLDRRAGASALHKACQGGHFAVVEQLLTAGALINAQCATTGHTPLVEAIWFGAEDIVALLLDRDARIELDTYYGFTIDDHITYATRANAVPAAQAALGRIKERVAVRRRKDDERRHQAALVAAVQAGDDAALKMALAAGMPVDVRWPVVGSFNDGHTALLVAAREGRTAFVEMLIAAGADVNAVEPVFGAVPLHKATYNGHADIVDRLVAAHGIDLDYQGPSNGYTPLLDALWHGYESCARLLIRAGARLDIPGYDGMTPLAMAEAKFGPQAEIVTLIKDRKGQ